MNIYVGNLSYESTEDEVRSLFQEYGDVSNVSLIKDKFTGRAKGFGFVEMPNNEEAAQAVEALSNQEVKGRKLTVNEAKPRQSRPPRH
ncbi:RNA-binding protein [Chitinispirillales bacterium ANBcel5]|uniref:RNA recognition motif domain-containing protein n=1 Tax=Cellulosispirillum alkaliphilum TaxID=3039283 RepID=UPI002A523F81|nr:RNA-binding protein [Chitinispirillales bacterium ANBcel5]